MTDVTDYFAKLSADPVARYWIEFEMEEARGDESAARLSVWRGLLLCKRLQAPFFPVSRRTANGR